MIKPHAVPFWDLWKNRKLAYTLIARDIASRYKGSWLGMFWSFLTPMLMLAIYTLVFGGIFRARWGQGSESTGQFALILFAGMLVFNLFSEAVLRAPGLIIGNVSYVKKIVFPLQLQSWVVVGTALFNMLLSVVVLLVAEVFLVGVPPWTVVFFPIVVFPLLAWVSGIVWLLSALGVFFRDVGQFIGLLVTMLMFLSPLFYPLSAVPERFRWLVGINPLAFAIDQMRRVMVFGQPPEWLAYAGYTAISIAVMFAGYAVFLRSRPGFADVL